MYGSDVVFVGREEQGDQGLHVGNLRGFYSGVDKPEDHIDDSRRIKNVDDWDFCWLGVNLVRWLGDGEHVFEN